MHRLFAIIIKSSFSFVTATPNSFLNIQLNSQIHLTKYTHLYDNRRNERKSWAKWTCDTSYMDRYVCVLYTYLPFSVSYHGTNYVVVAYSININRCLLRELEHFRHAIKLFSTWFTYDISFIRQIYFLFIVTFKEEIAEGFFTRSLDRAPGNWLNVEFLCKLWFVARADGDLDDAFKCVFLLRSFPIDRSSTFKYLQKIPFLDRMNPLLHFSHLKKRKNERQGNREIRISYISVNNIGEMLQLV